MQSIHWSRTVLTGKLVRVAVLGLVVGLHSITVGSFSWLVAHLVQQLE